MCTCTDGINDGVGGGGGSACATHPEDIFEVHLGHMLNSCYAGGGLPEPVYQLNKLRAPCFKWLQRRSLTPGHCVNMADGRAGRRDGDHDEMRFRKTTDSTGLLSSV